MIKSPPQKYNPKKVEDKIQKFWLENDIFKKSIEQRKNCKPYIFLEGSNSKWPSTSRSCPYKSYERSSIAL